MSRFRHFNRIAGFGLNLAHSILLVVFLTLVGAMAGALTKDWRGMYVGAVLGAIAGAAIAKPMFFGKTRAVVEPPPAEVGPGAYRWPGVEEQFARARKRILLLVLGMALAAVLLRFMYEAEGQGWQVLSSVPRAQLYGWIAGFILLSLWLIVLNARCPKCRHILRNHGKLHQCPHCGVVLRD